MSAKERRRAVIMAGVQAGELNLVGAAAAVLGLSYRQTQRVWRRYRAAGEAGLVHRLRGRPGPRRKPPELRAQVLARHAQRYPDFGPTLAAEYLAQEGWRVDHETLRRWLLAAGRWTVRRRRQRHRQWRERKPCFGAMVQLDGSHHDGFEGRRAPCVLMVMVDDATNRVWAQFFEAETTHASYDMLEGWARRYGLPQSLYVDRDSIYRCEGVGSIAEQIAGKRPQTQFGRAMEKLGVQLILAHSPQAKGRVERMNGVLQDRLVKALRLAGINDLAAANAYLAQTYLPELNQRFQVPAASAADVHQAVPRGWQEALSWEVERVVQRDWTVVYQGRWYQLDRATAGLGLAGQKVTVRRLRDGRIQLERGGVKLKWRELDRRPVRVKVPAVAGSPSTAGKSRPAANHPWRLQRIGSVRKAMQRRTGAARRVGASGRPPLRSGLPTSPTRHAENNNRARGHYLPSS
ncbi:MAG TPA: ISNCY family transposase [Verrucomicrobiota bacterium]|nr:ISNCY family transposase [Verrucomicrobiota bacterium]